MSTDNGAPDPSTMVAEQERFRLLAENASDVVLQAQADGTISWVSPSISRVLGWQPDQVVGHRPMDFLHPDDLPAIVSAQGRIAQGETLDFEARVRTSSDGYRWIASRVRPVLDDSGAVVGRVAAWRDIEAEHAAREALRDSEERFRLLAQSTSDVIYRSGLDGVIEWCSESVAEVLGYAPEEVVGRPGEEFLLPDDLAILTTMVEPAGGDSLRWPPVRLQAKDGTIRWAVITSRTIHEGGQAVGFLGGWRDITAEHNALEALERSEGRYRLLAENASDIVYQSGPDRLISWIAPTVEPTLGWTPEELVGTSFNDLIHPDDRPVTGPQRERLYSGQTAAEPASRLLMRLRAKDGRYLWFSGTATPIRDADGKPAGVVAGLKFVDDLVAERHRAADEAARRQAVLDTLLDPHVLLQAVRDESGVIVDFIYADANEAACAYNQTPRERLVGARLLDLLPGQAGSGMLAMYVQAVESGQPLVLHDYAYPHEILGSERRFDIRAARVGDALSFTWRDVTERYEAAQRIAASEELLRINMDAVQDPLVLLGAVRDPDTGGVIDLAYLDVNRATCEYLSMQQDDLIGKGLLELSPGLVGSGLFSLYVAAIDSDTPTAVDDFLYANELLGVSRYYDVRARRVSGDRLSLTWRDVTERHEAAQALAESEERFRLLAENSSDVVLLARNGILLWLSPSLTTALGWQPEEWVGDRLEEFMHPDDVALAQQGRAEITEGASRVMTLRLRDAHGEYHWVEIHAGPFINAQGQQDGIVASFRVVDSEVAAQNELEHLARFDTLTGVLNRKEILHKLSGITAGGRRPGERTAVLFCDIDRFKEINDTYGHAAGDEVLRTLAERIGATVRDEDHVARIGGDELLVILTGVHGLDDAVAVAEKIRDAASVSIGLEHGRVTSTLSIGVTLMRIGETVDDLIARADQAMYDAKSGGRNQVVAIDLAT